MADDVTPAGDEAGTTKTEESTSELDDRTAAEFRAVADALRARVDLFGKTLAAVATLGTTAVGLSKVGDLFPADELFWEWVWAIVACLALIAAGLAAIGIAVRLMEVSRPVFLRADLRDDLDLESEERSAVEPVFEAAARQFGYGSLVGLEQRERALRNAAAWTPDEDERTRRLALADEVKVVISRALAQAQVVVVRRRSAEAVSAKPAWRLYIAVIAGLIVFAVGADQVKSDRVDRVAEAKACGDARKAGATSGELGRTNGVCDSKSSEPEKEAAPPSAAEARATVAAQLATVLEACTALVNDPSDSESGPLENEDCDPVRRALATADPAPGGG